MRDTRILRNIPASGFSVLYVLFFVDVDIFSNARAHIHEFIYRHRVFSLKLTILQQLYCFCLCVRQQTGEDGRVEWREDGSVRKSDRWCRR